ncbi:MAG: hypothetical protein IPM02_25885 [Betaproteobacteria bacterium]|nr:hypothetical protein [Betaproteobacteria bacterium]
MISISQSAFYKSTWENIHAAWAVDVTKTITANGVSKRLINRLIIGAPAAEAVKHNSYYTVNT